METFGMGVFWEDSLGIYLSLDHLVEGITSGERHWAVLQGRNGS